MRVLLVEDDEPVAGVAASGLLRYGFQVDWVTTGHAALAHQGPYDVVLLDLGLPDTDGLDVCKALRTRGDVPIIVIGAQRREQPGSGLETGRRLRLQALHIQGGNRADGGSTAHPAP